jgi:hypothetical protein
MQPRRNSGEPCACLEDQSGDGKATRVRLTVPRFTHVPSGEMLRSSADTRVRRNAALGHRPRCATGVASPLSTARPKLVPGWDDRKQVSDSRPSEAFAAGTREGCAIPAREPRTRPKGARLSVQSGEAVLGSLPGFFGEKESVSPAVRAPRALSFQPRSAGRAGGSFEAPGVSGALDGPEVDRHTAQAKVGNRVVLGA